MLTILHSFLASFCFLCFRGVFLFFCFTCSCAGAGTRQKFLITNKNAHTLMFFSNYLQAGISKRGKMKNLCGHRPSSAYR